jgi:hypothetical protein
MNSTTAANGSCDSNSTETLFDKILEKTLNGNMFFHQLALILCAIFMCLSISISGWLILDHALHYLKPYEQKQ